MGPLAGLNVIEMAGIGPAPFAGMMLSDMGADVLRIDRKTAGAATDSFERVKAPNFVDRGRRSIALDLKHPEGAALALDLIAGADAVIEGFRPGVMERLGLGPDVCLARNPKLVFGRVTGWGQSRAARRHRRPRHQLHRADRRAARHRRRRGAAAAAQPHRRFRRRRDDAGVRRGLRAAGGASAPGAGRWSTPR